MPSNAWNLPDNKMERPIIANNCYRWGCAISCIFTVECDFSVWFGCRLRWRSMTYKCFGVMLQIEYFFTVTEGRVWPIRNCVRHCGICLEHSWQPIWSNQFLLQIIQFQSYWLQSFVLSRTLETKSMHKAASYPHNMLQANSQWLANCQDEATKLFLTFDDFLGLRCLLAFTSQVIQHPHNR